MLIYGVCGSRTGYMDMRESNAALLGKGIIDQLDDVYGLDEEGEIKGSYRPCGYPGVSNFASIQIDGLC